MAIFRNIYRVTRSIVFSAIALIAALYLLLYIALAIPSVQDCVRNIAQSELSKLFGSELSIGKVEVYPFNEVVVYDVSLLTPEGKKCAAIEKLGAGVELFHLISRRRIEISYVELIGLDARIWQERQDGPLNIQFLIDAFAPKEKNKPPTRFDLSLHSVVIRDCKASFNRLWKERGPSDRIDFNHLYVSDLNADVDIPRLSNDDYVVDLRRLSLVGPAGFDLKTLSLTAHITPHSISIRNLIVKLPNTEILPSDISLEFPSFVEIPDVLHSGTHNFVLVDSRVTPSDFAAFLPQLKALWHPYIISADLSGNLQSVDINSFSLVSFGLDPFHSIPAAGREILGVKLKGSIDGLEDIGHSLESDISKLDVVATASELAAIIETFGNIPVKLRELISRIGYVAVDGSAKYILAEGEAAADLSISTSLGNLDVKGRISTSSPVAALSAIRDYPLKLAAEVASDGINVGSLLDRQDIGTVAFALDADGRLRGGNIDGEASLFVDHAFFRGLNLADISANVRKEGHDISCAVSSGASEALFSADALLTLSGADSRLEADIDISRFLPSAFGFLPSLPGYEVSGRLDCSFEGNNIDNVSGWARGNNLAFSGKLDRGSLFMNGFNLDINQRSAEEAGLPDRSIRFNSDFLDADLSGNFSLSSIGKEFRNLLSGILPAFIKRPEDAVMASSGEFMIKIKPSDRLYSFLKSPFLPLVEIPIIGSFDMPSGCASLNLDVPYLQQGKDKLVRDTRLDINVTGESNRAALAIHTIYPSKKGDAELEIDAFAVEGDVGADVSWLMSGLKNFNGSLSVGLDTGVKPFDKRQPLVLRINPTCFSLSDEVWHIGESKVTYADKCLEVEKFRIWHDDQFVTINGMASSSPDDVIEVKLADIDLGFIFDTLNINYVTFGGTAFGEMAASGVFSPRPVASTRFLEVKDLSYNGCVLGDGNISSRWINSEKEVEIKADIKDEGRHAAYLDGGIWLGADSLNFKIDADKVNIAFLQPFMQAFSSDVGGRASGKANLYGNFKDIDLTGRLFADSISMKLDYTNVYYHGSDSVRIDPGHIHIPSFRLYDKYGNSAVLSGDLTHNYFHEPRFNFKIADANRLLCYDTDASINPVWYGRIFGNGGGIIRGWPGIVSIDMDMSTAQDSDFTFVISDEQEAGDYDFLSFTDKRKEERIRREVRDTVPDFLSVFRKKVEESQDRPSAFSLNLFATVTPDALLTIVMDPEAGDKITARGAGPMQLGYDSEKDDITMYGKYTLDEGKYNFTLQELILRDFTIMPGSSISFNGDPMRANLDIKAAYRVNTNLSDLDKSFASDPELNRTNVPVDAILFIDGEMDHPEISFDIELPTLTSDITRKVKSIISTDDLMSRQVIYLLALNRFYTPEYMGNTSGGGGELASVASSTLSSQFSRIVGQLTDKVDIMPSFRSDKGDFSDFEMDLALSSRLLNNRLLINGNFGYRDRSTSTTTFVGDFDIEYLLNRSGNLRLKAYNHFNDQNYYLKSSLTTQGIGVIFRRDFDNPFSFIRRRRSSLLSPSVRDEDKDLKKDSVPDKKMQENDSVKF